MASQRKVPSTESAPRHPDPEVVRKAEQNFAIMGLEPEDAVARFYELIADHCELCLRTGRIPNEETLAALQESKEETAIYDSVDQMMADFCDADPTHLSPVPARPQKDG